jgi:Flp pilus assembly protein TadD
MLRGILAVSLIALSTGASGQAVDESALNALDTASPGSQTAGEPAGAAELRASMRRIALRPDDADALADAGNASLVLGDANAALNFFSRANAIRPRNGRITAGLATATVQTENPFEALRLFDEAVRLGISERTIAADRGLAFDLLGNFARAQQDYQLARSNAVTDDLTIRQAISLSLAGQKENADGLLLPLLQKNNGPAWRARAFMLAARGDAGEAAKVAQGFLDAGSAARMERYLRLIPDLTGAQQAAAIHLGHFPASNIGRDSENVRRVAATIATPALPKAESRLIPTGTPLGNKAKVEKPAKAKPGRKRERDAEAGRLPDPATAPLVKVAAVDRTGLATDSARAAVQGAQIANVAVAKTVELPPPETARPLVSVATSVATVPISQPLNSNAATPSPASPPTTPPSLSAAAPPTAVAVQGPGSAPTSPAAVVAASVPALPTVQAPAPVATPAFDLAAIVGSIQIPDSEQRPSVVPVDLKKLKTTAAKTVVVDPPKAAKADPKAAAKAVAAANPARFWVQIATGDAGALGFDYRKWTKKNADLFKGKDGWTSAWGKTSRLLVGPFADLKASKKWEADFRKAGGNGFAWKSEDGVIVTALKGK